ncbi:MAG: hypothetical protein LUE29_06330, partial [Lachnospiraceae bacterium]|nr:hypothetical protein [Lachnospiraceae bacterium]
GGTVTGGYCGVGIYAGNSTSDMSTLIVNGGSISAFGFGVSTNGSYSYDYIEINGGTIYGGGTGMYLPAMESSTVINDGTITGGNTGIEIRAGSLEVTGGTIKSEYTGSLATENNNSGTTVVGAGIAVSQHTTDKAITVAISGGEISGIYGVYEINYNTSNTSEVKVNVTEDSDGTSATITTTDSSQGAAVYSTSLDTSSTKTNAQNASVTSIALSAGTYNSDVSEYCGTSYTTTTSNGGTTYTVTTGSAVVSVTTSDGNTTQYANLKAALAAASAGDTVTLLGDLTIDSQLTIDKDITLDLGGYTLTNTFVNESGTGANRFTLITTADVTIQNGTYVTTAPETTNGVETRGICQSSGDLTLSDLTVTCNGINVCNYAEEGKLTITNCNISGTYAVSSFANKSTVTITDSTLTGSVCGLYHNGSYYGLTLTATDTTITGGSADSSVEGATDATAVYISGSTYTVANNNDEEHQVSFTNCTITGSTGIEVKYTDLTLTNCTVTATGTTPTYEQYNNGSTTAGFAVVSTDNSMDGEDPLPSGTVIIKGGTYTGEVGLASIVDTETYTNFKEANYEIYAGTFSTDVSDYCVDGLTAAATGDVFIIVEESAVAVVYDKDDSYVGSYTTLKTAYAAVTDGGTMILVNDVDGEQLGATSDKEVTLDLNGYIISRDSGSVIDCSNGTLTIKDSSQTDSAIGTGMVQGNGNVALKLRGGTVVLESGTLESTSTYAVTMSSGTLTVNGGAVIAASNANCIFYYTGGTLMINDGLFTVVDRASTVEEGDVTGAIVNVGSSTASTASEDDEETNVQVSITGGVFQMYRPLLGSDIELEITGGYFLSKYSLSEYYPVGYGYTKVDSYTYLGTKYTNYYQVAHINFTLAVTSGDTTTESYYKTLVAAVNAAIDAYASTGSATITIKLENDYETGKVPVEKEVEFTLNLNGYTLTSTDVGVFKINNSDATVTIIDDSEAGTGTITTADSSTATTSTTGLFQVSSGTLNITGGYFNQNAGQSLIAGSGTVNITGGYFTSDPSDYIGNYEVATNDSETYHCYVADIISGKNIDLDNGKITLNVYVNESIIDATISASMTGAANDATVNDNVVSQKVEAKMMADDLAVTVTLSNGYVVTYKTSVEEYADEQLETLSVDSETDAAEIAVLTAMLDYGTAVQEFYSYNTENKANDGTYSSDVDKVSESDLKSAATRKSSTSGNWTSSNKISSWNMYGNYDVTLTMTYSFELTDYTASVMIGGETYENISTNGKVLTISGLGVEQLSKSLVVTITNSADNSSYTITTTGLYYARLMVTSGTDAQKKVGQTIYLYAKALN